jgi:glycerophosphoryl diester phosphodiesterase
MVTVPLVQLVDVEGAPYDLVAAGDTRGYADLLAPTGLADVATYAAAIGAHKALVLPEGSAAPGRPSLVEAVHAAGLLVHAWTVRDENRYLAERFRIGTDPDARGDAAGQTLALLEAGVDGVFTDHPDTAVQARALWLERRESRRPQRVAAA